jgi:hypothetical protein
MVSHIMCTCIQVAAIATLGAAHARQFIEATHMSAALTQPHIAASTAMTEVRPQNLIMGTSFICVMQLCSRACRSVSPCTCTATLLIIKQKEGGRAIAHTAAPLDCTLPPRLAAAATAILTAAAAAIGAAVTVAALALLPWAMHQRIYRVL